MNKLSKIISISNLRRLMKVSITFLLLILISCSSAKRAAIKLTEGGMHEAALDKWAEAYRNDPEDVEALVGFKQCQEKVSNDRLVRIRDLRNAHDEELALKEFQDLIDLQNLHGIRLDYNSSTFQGKEVALLWKYQESQLEAFLRAKKPLAAEHRFQKYFAIFQSQHGMEEIKNKINLAGTSQCRDFKAQSATSPFFMQFTNQFCRYFTPGKKLSSKKVSIKDVLFANPNINILIRGVEPEVNSRMGNSIQEAFRSTPWFHQDGKKIPSIHVSGNYKWNRKTWDVSRAHSYTVEVPYTDYENIRREKTVTDADGKVTTETYYESEPVTKYTTESRVYKYFAKKRDLELEIVMGGKILLDKNTLPFNFSDEETITRFVHHESLPDIGLHPSTEDVPTPGDKADEYAYRAGNELIGELNELWRQKFCNNPSSQSHSSLGENVMRCRKVKEYNQRFVDSWFTNQLGINFEETEKLIGKF